MKEGLYATIDTDKGSIQLELYYDKTPGTVGNFVGLAEGKIANDHKDMGAPYYDGLQFHRVIPDFMIQGGCPLGSGVGGPGYQFDDEIHPELKHNEAGILSMANAGPGTNGSQFFITHTATDWLDGKHTVFGKVIEGMDVVNQIAQSDVIQTIRIDRIGKQAEEWDALASFEEFKKSKASREAAAAAAEEENLKEHTKGMNRTDSGLYYNIQKEGTGATPGSGKTVSVHYRGMLMDGTVFDSSYQRNQPIDFPLGEGRVIPGWDEGIALLKKGSAAKLVIPSELAYGAQGAGGVIPPNATLIFEVELVDFR